jgi:hypothetical protein
METQTKYGGLGPPGTLRTATSELPPDGDEFEARTYIFMGLGVRSTVRYRLRGSRAIIEWLRGRKRSRSVEVDGAEIEAQRSLFCDRGNIRIFTRDGQCLVWNRVRELSRVAAALERAASAATG